MAARASKLKSYSHSTFRPAPALNPDMLYVHSFATSHPRDCDRCTLRPSALPTRRSSRAPAHAVSPARRGRRHLLPRDLFFGEGPTSTTRCACPRTPLALSRAPHPPHPPPTLIAHAIPPCTQPSTCLPTTTPPHPSRHPLCRRSREAGSPLQGATAARRGAQRGRRGQRGLGEPSGARGEAQPQGRRRRDFSRDTGARGTHTPTGCPTLTTFFSSSVGCFFVCSIV